MRGSSFFKKARFALNVVKSNVFCDGPWSPIQLALSSIGAISVLTGLTHQNGTATDSSVSNLNV